ncbi:hypothetical protein [Chryseolinea lacunae]|uniref:Uncharacterized protein n=1 Tax=Chryseolinea lacunae TaxID=2801331 RepID=A0ABS1L0N9_9BACT|nr:hypothetical protein [Chryseolinea lacunae]MBL0745145.1 hypothetical protein [Chryseolinea lacunae]
MNSLTPFSTKNILVFMAFASLLLAVWHDGAAQSGNGSVNYHPRNTGDHNANFHPDTVRVEFPEHRAVVSFALRRYKRHNAFLKDFPTALHEVLDVVRKSIADTNVPQKITVIYKPDEQQEITLQPGSTVTTVTTQKNNILRLLPPGWEITMITRDVNVWLYAESFAGLEALAQEDYSQLITTIDASLASVSLGKKSIKARLVVQQHQIKQQKVDYNYPADMIGLTASVGAGFVREKFYPEASTSLALYFADHYQRLNHRVELIYNAMVFTERAGEGNYSTHVNSFLSLAYSHNWNRTGGRERWGGLGLGYQVGRQGDYFKGKTAKLFFVSDIGSTKLNLVPEFYLTNDLKTFAFGLKLNYTF